MSLSFSCCRVKYTPNNDLLSTIVLFARKIQDGRADCWIDLENFSQITTYTGENITPCSQPWWPLS